MRTVRIYAVAASILIVLGAFFLFYSLSSPTSDSSPMSLTSPQWAGYVTMSNLLLRQPLVTSVSGSWTVPSVDAYSQDDAFSAAWVGVGGYGENTLIQAGTLHGVKNGEVVYYAWYELLPNTAVRIENMHVKPGDRMTASVSLVDGSSNTWLVEITDSTNGESFSRTFGYTSSRLSAEWILERPTISGSVTTLADFSSITFTACQATIEDITGSVDIFPGYQLVMYNDQTQLVRVSSLSANGSSFTVDYLQATG